MKQRKLKLLSSFVALCLIFAVLAVGVWAAASQTVNVKTTVKFSATGISGTITGTLTGLDSTTYYYNSTNASGGSAITFTPKTSLSDWTLGDTTACAIDSSDGVPSSIVYTFTIANTSTTEDMNVEITSITPGTNIELTSITQDATTKSETSGTYTLTAIGEGTSSTIVLTFDVTDSSTSISSTDIQFTINLTHATVA